MSYNMQSLGPKIHAILSAPDVDLTTISAKRVRKQLMEEDPTLTITVVRENKEEIDSLISRIFEEVSGVQQSSEDEGNTRSNKRKTGDEDVEEEPQTPRKKKAKNGQEKSDAKLARKLSNEINGRPTRGASRSHNGAAKKGGRRKKSATVVDSDDERNGDSGKKKRGGGGGFGKEYNLSEPLSTLLQVDKLSRPQVVKALWDHIKSKGLQDPTNKREIICDPSMKAVFNVDKIGMFQMNKVLGQHLYEPES